MLTPSSLERVRTDIIGRGHSLVRGRELTLSGDESAWPALADDWWHLETDRYMSDGGRYRLRRFGRFYFVPSTSELRPLSHAPVFQTRTVNTFAGGMQRHFEPLRASTFANECLRSLVRFDFSCFSVADDRMLRDPWEVWIHQIRIEASGDAVGRPAPEGVHHDGHDFIAMHLVYRDNVSGGNSMIYDNDQREMSRYLLEEPLDTIYADDHQVMHNVEPICAASADRPARRDMLIIDFDHRPALRPSD